MGNNLNYYPRLPSIFRDLGINGKTFFLIDIGVSGGIANHWQCFGDNLEAIGFDPLIAEIERLKNENKNPKIRYEEAFISYNDLDKNYPSNLRNEDSLFYSSFGRSSAVRVSQKQNYNYVQHHFNDGKPVVYSNNFIQLDDFIKKERISNVDFIKVDTDGSDLPVLLGGKNTLETCNVLGVEIEAQFHGSPHPYANTFSNIDIFLKSQGFTLFNLDNYYYSRAALPSKFLYGIYAQTISGGIQWGEALYFRDLADKNYTKKFNFPITLDKVIKLACLYEKYGLNDCAAELLINRAEEFGFQNNLDVLLNAITPPLNGKKIEYKDYVKKFDENPQEWLCGTQEERNERIARFISSKMSPLVNIVAWVYGLFKRVGLMKR